MIPKMNDPKKDGTSMDKNKKSREISLKGSRFSITKTNKLCVLMCKIELRWEET